MASEMLYPVVPVYLKEIGFSVLLIGILEGIAEATAGISKGYFGKKSDEEGVRLPFIKGGYFLSALSKPMMAFFTFPVWIFFSRTIDRLGKGLRTAARDALLSDNATPPTKARVFGFHRGMDTLGAVIGPVLALLFLNFFPSQYVSLFYMAFIPGLIAVVLIFLLKEKKQPPSTIAKGGFFSFFNYWKEAPQSFKKLVIALLFFSFINSSDVFILLKTKEITGDDRVTIISYIFYNLVFAAASYPLGKLADKIGFKKVFCGGLFLFSIAYLLFAFSQSTLVLFCAFAIYGIYAAATEGVAKAWLTNISHKQNTATAIGFYTSCQSLCALLASIIAGLLWTGFNSWVTFFFSAIGAVVVVMYLQFIRLKET